MSSVCAQGGSFQIFFCVLSSLVMGCRDGKLQSVLDNGHFARLALTSAVMSGVVGRLKA